MDIDTRASSAKYGYVQPQWFGAVADGVADDTVAINAAIDYAKSAGIYKVFIPSGAYKVTGTINFSVGELYGSEQGTIIIHYPPDDTTDCLVVRGLNAGRSQISNITIKGLQNGHTFGRDLLVIGKGDYPVIRDVYIEKSKRDTVHVEPYGSFQWIENVWMENVKTQDAGRDAFNFTLPDINQAFINQVTLVNCESRGAIRHALSLFNSCTVGNTWKLGCFRFMNCEFAAAAGSEPIVKINTTSLGAIESIAFQDSVVECTTANRTGAAIEISGNAFQGAFIYENGNIYGTTGGKIVGASLFPRYDIWDLNSNTGSVPHLTSHVGISRYYQTGSIATNASETTTVVIPQGEIVEGYVVDKIRSGSHFCKFVVWNGTYIYTYLSNNVSVSLNAGAIVITQLGGGTPQLILMTQRVTKNY